MYNDSLASMPMGELEMVLRSLDLAKLIPNFREHRISFADFLRFTDADLQAVNLVYDCTTAVADLDLI